MTTERFPRSLREADGHTHGNSYIHDSTPPSLTRTLVVPLVIVVVLALILLCYAVAPNTKAYDCKSDTECVVLRSLKVEEKK